MTSFIPTSVSSQLTSFSYSLLDTGSLPDSVVRFAIRKLCQQRLDEIASVSLTVASDRKWKYIQDLKVGKVAIEQKKANEQHYEVSTPFMQSCLGPRMKYSCCLYPTGKETLAQAEVLMLESYCEKAKLEDGMDILDLGCGWGSLCLFLAEKYPNSNITALSNSKTQKLYIDSQAALKGFMNVSVVTGDVTEFDWDDRGRFDRILSIEMFEHMKNYESLLSKISTWLKPNALAKGGASYLFVHIFCHKDTPYHFEENDGWMSQNFFSGGTMPSYDLFLHFQSSLSLVHSWYISGNHYSLTCEDWLRLQDKNKVEKGTKESNRFRVFYMACAEFFKMGRGEEWGVGHYLFKNRD